MRGMAALRPRRPLSLVFAGLEEASMGHYFDFFATKQDSLDLLLSLEKKSPLFYARWGYYPAPQAPTFDSVAELPDLGLVTRPHKGDNRYIVFPNRVQLDFRSVPRKNGETDYVTIPPKGTPWVWFSSGGHYLGEENRPECVITGIVETGRPTASASGSSIASVARFVQSLRELKGRNARIVWAALFMLVQRL